MPMGQGPVCLHQLMGEILLVKAQRIRNSANICSDEPLDIHWLCPVRHWHVLLYWTQEMLLERWMILQHSKPGFDGGCYSSEAVQILSSWSHHSGTTSGLSSNTCSILPFSLLLLLCMVFLSVLKSAVSIDSFWGICVQRVLLSPKNSQYSKLL